MVRRYSLFLILWIANGLLPPGASADPTPPSWDEDRLSGFREYVRQQKVFDREREKAEQAYLEEKEEWERQRQLAIKDYKKEKKVSSPLEGGPEYREYLSQLKDKNKEREEIRQTYSREKARMLSQKRRKIDVTEAEELGLKQARPRYEVSKRVLYGAPSPYGKSGSQANGGGRRYTPPSSSNRFSSPGSAFQGEAGGDFPPPPSFDGSDLPPPPPIDYEDLPPPPPPDSFEVDEFPPPPDFGDLPPPPPPPPVDDF